MKRKPISPLWQGRSIVSELNKDQEKFYAKVRQACDRLNARIRAGNFPAFDSVRNMVNEDKTFNVSLIPGKTIIESETHEQALKIRSLLAQDGIETIEEEFNPAVWIKLLARPL